MAGARAAAVGRVDSSGPPAGAARRSEEHTSELQSRLHLVCRLLLEKKKNSPHSFSVIRQRRGAYVNVGSIHDSPLNCAPDTPAYRHHILQDCRAVRAVVDAGTMLDD